MTREEFTALPLGIALGLLWDQNGSIDDISRVPAPQVPRSPKFDSPIYRKGGLQWASEMDLEGLRFWHRVYTESAQKGGEYAEKDRKRASQISHWVAWRAADPSSRWRGIRGETEVTAEPPSGKPAVYARAGEDRQRRAAEPEPQPFADDFPDNGDIPF